MKTLKTISRRKALNYLAASSAGILMPKLLLGQDNLIAKRVIPSTGEQIGMVGLGTWQTFDVGNNATAREPLREVLKILISKGGSLVDSSPMYGSSETVVGDLIEDLSINDSIFRATKVWTTGEENGKQQMRSSMQKMKTNSMDLMQIHNLQDWKTHIRTLYNWKEQGLIRYIGITHYVNSSHDDLERIIRSENIDFVQVNYSIIDRNAEKSLLPSARDKGVAVLANRPYAGGSLFRKVRGKELPKWASEIECKSWGQLFLKYLLGNPAVTCVIPGTSKPKHMMDNVGAGMGRMPSGVEREKMVDLVRSL